jgi:flagellar hook-length control protein FliK
MQQIRFDFLGGVNGSNNSRTSNANANPAETGDAFAQILDQQLTRRADAGPDRRAAEPRARSDASDRTDETRPQVLKRRDNRSDTAAKSETSAKPAPKAKQPEKTAAEHETCAKPAARPQPDDANETTETAASAPTTTESNSANGKTEAEGDTPGDTKNQQQQPDDGSQQQASDGTDPSETIAADADMSLLAVLAVPLPLQTVTADADTAVEATNVIGDNAAAALQAGLAASLAGSIDLSAGANAKTSAPTSAAGLKFGAILNAGIADPQKAGADAAAALQDAAVDLAKAADPLAQPAPDADGPSKDTAPATGSKARETAQDKAAATVTPELNAKATAAIVQPMARASAVTWSGTTNIRNELAESMSVQAGASFAGDDSELSNWSQVLGSGAGGISGNLSARQTAFMTQLRQNVQNLPAQEQIAVQIKNAMQNGNSRLTVALHPVELGRVEVKLDIDKDKNVTATIVVDRPATLDMLRNDSKALERALQDAGLQTGNGSLSFNLRDSNGQNGGTAQNGTGTNGSGQGTGAGGSEVKAEARADVVATADGYVDLET